MQAKLYQLLLRTACLFSGILFFSFPAHAELIGNIDQVNEETLEGYAWDSSAPVSLTLQIQIKKDGSDSPVKSFEFVADQYREDLAAQSGDDGCHAFSLPIDWSELGEGKYQIDLYHLDQKLGETLSYTYGMVEEDAEENTEEENTDANTSLQSLGVFKLTGYCPCNRCSEGWGRHTATGAIASSNHTIAVDPSVIPYGTQVMINGIIYTAEDRGGGVRGKHIDIFYDTHAETRQHGTTQAEVFLV
ncbi:MAG: 3D domain-containing protein [bacterium]|nr:3D domain-containing protein [bacterium]